MHIEIEAMRQLVWQAASLLEKGRDATQKARFARCYANEKAMWIADNGIQVLGGHGFIREHPVEMWFRNARTALAVLEGMRSRVWDRLAEGRRSRKAPCRMDVRLTRVAPIGRGDGERDDRFSTDRKRQGDPRPRTRAEALICRKYARYYDENEDELPPGRTLPEAGRVLREPRAALPVGPDDTQGPVMMGSADHRAVLGRLLGPPAARREGGLGNAALAAAGTHEQKAKWGNLLLSMAITEPGCGSDPSRVSTTAVLDEKTNEWVLNGEKIFVTTGIRATGVVIWATIDKSAGRAGIKSFLVEKGTPGFETTHKEKKLGIRADDTAAYVFTDCRIPRENLLGLDESIPKSSSGGFRGVMKTFNMTRPATAAMGLGCAEAAIDLTREELEKAGVNLDYTTGPGGLANLSAAAEKFMRLEALYEASKLTTAAVRCWLAGEGQAEQHGVLGLQGPRGRRGSPDHPGLHRDPRADGHLARAPAREVDARLPHHRHLRGHGRDPAPDHRARSPPSLSFLLSLLPFVLLSFLPFFLSFLLLPPLLPFPLLFFFFLWVFSSSSLFFLPLFSSFFFLLLFFRASVFPSSFFPSPLPQLSFPLSLHSPLLFSSLSSFYPLISLPILDLLSSSPSSSHTLWKHLLISLSHYHLSIHILISLLFFSLFFQLLSPFYLSFSFYPSSLYRHLPTSPPLNIPGRTASSSGSSRRSLQNSEGRVSPRYGASWPRGPNSGA